MTDYPPTEYGDWQRARGHMTGQIPLRTLEQARVDLTRERAHAKNVRRRAVKDLNRLFPFEALFDEARKRGAK